MAEQSNVNSEITKKDLKRVFWRWTFHSHSNYNYERLQATGVIYAFSPILKKLYGNDPEKMKAALERHMQFFNTEPSFGGPILSIALAMEEERAKGNGEISDVTINGFKTGLMGPLAGIGDTLWQGTLIPILLSFTIDFGSQGNILMGPIMFFALHMIIMLIIAYRLWFIGYDKGKEGILKLMNSGLLDKVLTFSQTLGSIVIGALAAQFVKLSTPISLALGEGKMEIQTQVFDALVKGLLPLSLTLFTFYLLKKKLKPTQVLLTLLVIGLVFGFLGILA